MALTAGRLVLTVEYAQVRVELGGKHRTGFGARCAPSKSATAVLPPLHRLAPVNITD